MNKAYVQNSKNRNTEQPNRIYTWLKEKEEENLEEE